VVFAIAWFQVSHAGAAFVIAIGVFWINYFATYSAVKNVDARYYELAQAFGQGSYVSQTLKFTLPAALPGIMGGIRAGVGQAWMTLIAAELLGVPGIGQEMNSAAGVGAYEAVVVYMLAISIVYALSDIVFGIIERSALAWRP
jgi:NitT/TauT family transport system permease protein